TLAAAYHAAGELDLAVRYEEQALEAWPDASVYWTLPSLSWYRHVERYYFRLLRLRQAEEARNPGRFQWEQVDNLFDKVRYAGPGGEFEPGTMARASRDELPPDAFAVLAQLLLWSPGDDRLYWQYAEFLNAFGDMKDANLILTELVDSRAGSNKKELMAHRTALKRFVDAVNPELDKLPGGLYELANDVSW